MDGWRSKKDSAAKADAATLGDAWLAPAIQKGLLQPVPAAQSSAWWVRRNIVILVAQDSAWLQVHSHHQGVACTFELHPVLMIVCLTFVAKNRHK